MLHAYAKLYVLRFARPKCHGFITWDKYLSAAQTIDSVSVQSKLNAINLRETMMDGV